jgi:hypothetical protein
MSVFIHIRPPDRPPESICSKFMTYIRSFFGYMFGCCFCSKTQLVKNMKFCCNPAWCKCTKKRALGLIIHRPLLTFLVFLFILLNNRLTLSENNKISDYGQ